MPTLVIPNSFTNNVSSVDATTMNANFNQIATIVNGIDNANIGALGVYASQIIPTSAGQATFGGTQNYQTPRSLIIPSGATYAYGLLFTTATGLGVYGGSGVPTFSAANGSMALRYDGASSAAVVYVNTTGASSSGTTWTAVTVQASVYAVLQSAIITYTSPGTETNAAPGTMATVTFGALPTSPLAQWRINVEATVQCGTTTGVTGNCPMGIGTATAGATPFAVFSKNPNALTITGGNVRSDTLLTAALLATGVDDTVKYSAIFANGTTPSFTALLGLNSNTPTLNGMLYAIAFPSA